MKAGLFRSPLRLTLTLLLLVTIARLWIEPIRSSFWVDEMATVFVVHHGGADPSLRVAPQVSKSIYYGVARAADAIFGTSEDGYRLPSILFSGLALLVVAALARRLIDPRAGWFAAFACLALRGFNQEAADARPYALGFCVVAAAFFFLVRWLDSERRFDAAAFLVCAALVWRVHLLFWPIYIAFALYAAIRIARRETGVRWGQAMAVFAVLGVTLLPLAIACLSLFRGAARHVIVSPPTARSLAAALKWQLVVECAVGAWILSRVLRWKSEKRFPWAAAALIAGWWLIHPLCLLAFSWITGDSVMVPRYLSPALPGAALAATFMVGLMIPKTRWDGVTLIFALGVALVLGRWGRAPQPNSDWRDAAIAVNRLGANTPVICPSPFIEARWPDWRPDYPLPGFLYAHLSVYPIREPRYLFPFDDSPEAERYAARLTQSVLPAAARFAIYGGQGNVDFWREWFERRPELARFSDRGLRFGDVRVVIFDRRR